MPELKGLTDPKILAYGVPSDSIEGSRLRELASAKGIAVQDVLVEDFSQKLGAVVGLSGYERDDSAYDGGSPTHKIIWFCSVAREDLNWLLQEYSISGVQPIELKAVLTERNVNWTLAEHYEELQLEHRMMNAYVFIQQARGAFNQFEASDYTEESYARLAAVISEAEGPVKDLQRGFEIQPEVLEKLARSIKAAYQSLVPNV